MFQITVTCGPNEALVVSGKFFLIMFSYPQFVCYCFFFVNIIKRLLPMEKMMKKILSFNLIHLSMAKKSVYKMTGFMFVFKIHTYGAVYKFYIIIKPCRNFSAAWTA